MKAHKRQIVQFFLSLVLGSGGQAYGQAADSLKQAPDSASLTHLGPSALKGAYLLRGKVLDKQSGEPVPFATIFFPYSSIGTTTEADGSFSLGFEQWPHDTVRVQLMGYVTLNKALPRQGNDNLILELERNTSTLNEVVIRAGEDPALLLLRKIVERKPKNNPEQAASYSCETYNKVEIDIFRLGKKEFEKLPIPFIKQLSFVYNNLDTVSGKEPFLPFFLVETLSDYYAQKEPKKTREIIKANEIRGIKNESITQYMGKMHLAMNPYDNYVVFFDKQFVSPISNAGAVFYKYKILDTTEVEGHKVVSVSFKPQRPGENCFTGVFKVVDSIYALQYLEAEVPATANINWIKNATFYKQYAPVNDSLWFCVKENLTAEVVMSSDVVKLPGFIGRRTIMYRNVKLNDERVEQMIAATKDDVVVADTARNKSETFWYTARHEALGKNELAIYHMFDTLEKNPNYNRLKSLAKIF
ncbi:MAG: carboxypeptidase-like regulatory protein, partial [Flavipsychrobacter sp.]|nr:carboxypeptidase-like regulatory protein [Flavipsychrobacter sp.]